MDDLFGEILGQVQATKKVKTVAKEYKSAKRLAEEQEIANYEAEQRERKERNKLFEAKAKERALDARIREEVKKNKGRVTARMAKEFGMDLLIMQERYGSDVDILRRIQNEREKDSISTDWQSDKFAHGALKAQKLREQLAKNKKITAAAKVSKKAINFDEMTDDLTSREKRNIEIKKDSVIPTKISQGQNLSFGDILRQAKLNKFDKGEASKQKEKVNKVDKEKTLLDNKKTLVKRNDFKEIKHSNNYAKVESKSLLNAETLVNNKKQINTTSKKLDEYRHKNSITREDYTKKFSEEKIRNPVSSTVSNVDAKKSTLSKGSSLLTTNKHQFKINEQKSSSMSNIFKRPSEKRREMKEMKEMAKNSSTTKQLINKESSRKSEIEMDKIRALQERERKKQEIFKAMREVEILRNKGSDLLIEKKKDKRIEPKESSYYKNDKNYVNGRKRSHGIYDDYNRKKSSRMYDDYKDYYDSEDSLADFIDDEHEEELPDRKIMKEALRGIAKNYDRARWRENEKRISDRDMVSSFKEIVREERKSFRIGFQEDLEEAKKGSEAL